MAPRDLSTEPLVEERGRSIISRLATRHPELAYKNSAAKSRPTHIPAPESGREPPWSSASLTRNGAIRDGGVGK